jgi:hypothetical protein
MNSERVFSAIFHLRGMKTGRLAEVLYAIIRLYLAKDTVERAGPSPRLEADASIGAEH